MNKRHLFQKTILLTSAIIGLTWITPTFADNSNNNGIINPVNPYLPQDDKTPTGVTVNDFGAGAEATLANEVKGIATNAADITKQAIDILQKIIVDTAGIFTFNNQFPPLMSENQQYTTAVTNNAADAMTALDQRIRDSFNNTDTVPLPKNVSNTDPIDNLLASKPAMPAEDECLVTKSSRLGDGSCKSNNDIFNLSKIIETNTIADKTQQQNFQTMLNYLDPTTSMKIVRLGTNMNLSNANIRTYEEDHNAVNGDISLTSDNLITTLNANPDFRRYKRHYRSLIMAKMLPLEMIFNSYQQRLPSTTSTNGKSPMALEDAQLARLSSDDYYKDLASAPLAVLLRENVATNVLILSELRKMRRENEKAHLMDAVSSLQNLQMSATTLTQERQGVEQIINRWRNPTKTQGTAPDMDAATKMITG